jgi:hypothetical protein
MLLREVADVFVSFDSVGKSVLLAVHCTGFMTEETLDSSSDFGRIGLIVSGEIAKSVYDSRSDFKLGEGLSSTSRWLEFWEKRKLIILFFVRFINSDISLDLFNLIFFRKNR